MIPPLGRGHIGGTIIISSRDSISRGRSGAHSRHTRAAPAAAAEGPAAVDVPTAVEGPVAAREGPAAAEEGP